jgi:hypothetical protein
MAEMNRVDPGDVIEPKVCEGWECGATFYRRPAVDFKSGEKLCPRCRAKEAPRIKTGGNHSRLFRELGLRKAS